MSERSYIHYLAADEQARIRHAYGPNFERVRD